MKRINALQKALVAEAAIIEDSVDLEYLTGLKLSRGALLITGSGAVLFVDGRYFAKAKNEAPCPVQLWEKDSLTQWILENRIGALAFDSAKTYCDRLSFLTKALPGVHLVPCSSLLKECRKVKSQEEIGALKKAFELTMKGVRFIEGRLKEGLSEEEIAFDFERFVRKNGASGLSFEPIIAFGENSAYPHHRAGKTKLIKDQIVLIDVGAVVDCYRGDLTRVVFFGKPDPILEQWLRWTKEAQQKAADRVKPGVKISEMDLAAREVFSLHGVEELFSHSLGHGIGLETHEFPTIRALGADRDVCLQEGMVITIEPGLYKPGVGGVRWEDMFVVSEMGCEKFSLNLE